MFNLKPTRSQSASGVLVTDLDALIETPVKFRLHGKDHILNPISTINFLKVVSNLQELMELKEDEKAVEKFQTEDFINRYYNLFHVVCDTITKKDIGDMTHAQAGALVSIVVEHIQGKTHLDVEKKKNQG